jgi:hypothetical protein
MGITETRSPHSSPERTSPPPERRVGVSPQSSDGGYVRSSSYAPTPSGPGPTPPLNSEGTAELEAALAKGMRSDRR